MRNYNKIIRRYLLLSKEFGNVGGLLNSIKARVDDNRPEKEIEPYFEYLKTELADAIYQQHNLIKDLGFDLSEVENLGYLRAEEKLKDYELDGKRKYFI